MFEKQLFRGNNFLKFINKINLFCLINTLVICMLLSTSISLTWLLKIALVNATITTAFLSEIFGLFPQRGAILNWLNIFLSLRPKRTRKSLIIKQFHKLITLNSEL